MCLNVSTRSVPESWQWMTRTRLSLIISLSWHQAAEMSADRSHCAARGSDASVSAPKSFKISPKASSGLIYWRIHKRVSKIWLGDTSVSWASWISKPDKRFDLIPAYLGGYNLHSIYTRMKTSCVHGGYQGILSVWVMTSARSFLPPLLTKASSVFPGNREYHPHYQPFRASGYRRLRASSTSFIKILYNFMKAWNHAKSSNHYCHPLFVDEFAL